MKSATFDLKEAKSAKDSLDNRHDAEAERLKRFLAMPDLSRTSGSPLEDLAQRVTRLTRFADFYVLNVPEIVRYDLSFDMFNFPPDHPARNPSDTYFLNKEYILRTHTTVMWAYHLGLEDVKEKIAKGESVGALSYGKVYRKDEIDRNHMNVFHQIDGWYLCNKNEHIITIQDLQDILSEIAKTIFGADIKYRFNKDQFPYTDPSLEMEVEIGNRWVEILGAGIVKGEVLKNFGVDPDKYNGWAFGFGLERLAIISMELPDIRLLWSRDERVKKQLKLGNKYKEVSKYPPITRDISFVVNNDFIPNNYFDLIRDLGGDLVEQVELLDKYENADKFGKDKISYTYRIVYRSNERTLTIEEIDPIQDKIYKETAEQFTAELR
ncbi:MAG: hypothetical protein Q7S43_03995 [bacterium]|nr:hypothetical protein [bacterium]